MGLEQVKELNYQTPTTELLVGSKKDRKARKEALEKEYVSIFKAKGNSEKEAKKLAKAQVKNTENAERVARTVTYNSKKEAKAAKKAASKEDRKFIQGLSKRDLKTINKNAEDFKTDDKIDAEKAKTFIHSYTGDDFNLNDGSNLERPEDHTMANYLNTSDHRAKHIAKKFGYATENLALKRTLHVATAGLVGGVIGAGSAKSQQVTGTFTSEAVVDHNGNVLTDAITDIVKTKVKYAGPITAGAVIGALGGLATINAVGGKKDLFNGRTPRDIIEKRNVKGLDESAKRVMAAIIADETMTDAEKIKMVEDAIGSASSSLCNKDELVALASRLLARDGNNAATSAEGQGSGAEAEKDSDDSDGHSAYVTSAAQNKTKPQSAKEEKPCQVVVQNGETLSKLAKKYGVTIEQLKELNKDKLRKFKHAKICDDNRIIYGFRVGDTITVPDGCSKAANNKSAKEANRDYENMIIKNYGSYCNDKHNIFSRQFENIISTPAA